MEHTYRGELWKLLNAGVKLVTIEREGAEAVTGSIGAIDANGCDILVPVGMFDTEQCTFIAYRDMRGIKYERKKVAPN